VRRLGLDIGGTRIKLALLDGDELVDTRTTETGSEDGPAAVAARAAALAGAAGEGTRVGVSLPGVIDADSGTARLLANLPGWEGIDPRAELARALGRPVSLVNDGHAFVLAESRLGAGRGARDVAGVVCGTGIGGALVLGSELHRGVGGRAGEIGHTTVAPDGSACGCGNRGCLELYAGSRAIARASGAETFEDAARAAAAGDERALRAVEDAGRALGIAIATLAVLVEPERIVVGGGTVEALGELLLGRVRAEVASRTADVSPGAEERIVAAELGSYAGAVGAALSAAG